ncbi:MAG: hypothetical protein F4X60_02600 [Gemmatimonadetes bacterium]|nr:hypothetical protein [Gemmatimonadota bacterium]MYB97434.1 hypothetical protein [Gemmatimonadota bacterium]
MNIVKASLRNAVRRKWKFALVVFLCGVGLVVLTNVYQVGDALERVGELSETIESGAEPPSDEEVREVARNAGLLFLFSALAFLFTFGTTLLAFVMPGGVVANERRSTAIMLWAQHPMPLTSFYLQRYAGIQVATVAALLIIGLTASLASFPADFGASGARGVPSTFLEGVLACAVSFGISALAIRRAAFFGFVYYLGSSFVGELMGDVPPPTTAVGEFVAAAVPFLIFPTHEIGNLVDGFGSGVAWDWGATGMIVYHFVLWTAVAWLGLRRLDRRPVKL